MIRNTIAVTVLLLLTLSGCKVVQVTPSGGSIQSASGLYDCPARERCEIEIEAGSTFTDTFTAEAVDGKRFVRWEKDDGLLCGGSSEPCELTLSPDLTAWPVEIYLVPVFENDTGDDVELQNRIRRIENGLEPHLQVIGQPVPTSNIESRLKELGVPGLSIAMVVDGKVEWAKGYGWADSAEKIPVDTETLFQAGSISKPVSTLRALQLVETGMLSLDDNANNYLTSWQIPDNQFTQNEKVTLRRLMNHTAGVTVSGFFGYNKGDIIPTVQEVLDGEGNSDPVRVDKVPGQSVRYSGGGYTIMQLMITDTENRNYPDIMKDNILDPLGMTGSTFENPLPKRYHSIAATGYRPDGEEVEGKWVIHPEMAAAGLWTTPSQLIQYAIEIQDISQNETNGLLKFSSVKKMLTPGKGGHGLGPRIAGSTFRHDGSNQGFYSSLIAWKDLPFALVIMVNSRSAQIIRELELAIATEYQLPGIGIAPIPIIDLSPEQLSKYVGTYELPDYGPLTIQISGNALEVSADFIDETVYWLPQSKTLFIDRDYLNQIHRFEIVGGNVTSLLLLGESSFRAVKSN